MELIGHETRFRVANQADAGGQLRAQAGVFVGALPPDENIANTSFHWSGVHWVQLGWPLPADRAVRDVLLMHELFTGSPNRLRSRSRPPLTTGSSTPPTGATTCSSTPGADDRTGDRRLAAP